MIISGIADEAGKTIQKQIEAHQRLGWKHIELRLADGQNVAGPLPEEEFKKVREAVQENGMQVTSFASAIANWSRPITGDFEVDRRDLEISIPRMQSLGVKHIRVMSWVGEDVEEPFWHDEAVRRLRALTDMAEQGDIILLHENCTGWGGLSADNMLTLKKEINSPHFELLYDIGNVISHGDEPWPFFETIRNHFSYIHIKDAKKNPQGGQSHDFQFCGEGDAMIPEILREALVTDGYQGTVSIEPHVGAIVHLGPEKQGSEEYKYASYLEYGKKLENILADIKQ